MGQRAGVMLSGQNARVMLGNAAWLTAIVHLLSFVAFLLMLATAAMIVSLMPGAWTAAGLVFALVFAWAVKAALIEPFAIAWLFQVFFNVTKGRVPTPEREARLGKLSDTVREMAGKATAFVTAGGSARGA